jgi:prepilin-type N-terminal cleavage/methylation domain-containing protein/prepilin-type processing-associated H-X9-DG protein
MRMNLPFDVRPEGKNICPNSQSHEFSTARRAGFTLVELLVVIAIIGILVALLMPAMLYSRNTAIKTQCQSQLREVGVALENYMNALGTHAKFPNAADLPSATPNLPTLLAALGKHIENNQQVFQCPADQTRFPVEGLSYEYAQSTLAGKTHVQVLQTSTGIQLKESTVQVAYDFDDVHGPVGGPTSRNILFLDCHVE